MNREVLLWLLACLLIAATAALLPFDPKAGDLSRAEIFGIRILLFAGPLLGGLATARFTAGEVDNWLLRGAIAIGSFLVLLLVWVNLVIVVVIIGSLMGIDLVGL